MKHLKFALVLGVFTLTAIPAQAAQASGAADPCVTKSGFSTACITDADIAPCKETLRKGLEYEKAKGFVGKRDISGTDDAAIKEYVARSTWFTANGFADVATLKGVIAGMKRDIAGLKQMSPERQHERVLAQSTLCMRAAGQAGPKILSDFSQEQ